MSLIIHIGNDHAVSDEKKKLVEIFSDCEFVNHGTDSSESVNYPDFSANVCKAVLKDSHSRGILLCGSGIGMSIAANRFKGIRAALCRDVWDAEMCRRHNNANVLCLGVRKSSFEDIVKIIRKWVDTEFEGGRHQDRIDLIETCSVSS